MYKFTIKILSFISFLAFNISCSSSLKTQTFREHASSYSDMLNQSYKEIEKDYAEKDMIIDILLDKKIDITEKPYKELKDYFEKLKLAKHEFYIQKNFVEDYHKKLSKLENEKEYVSPMDESYSIIKEYQKLTLNLNDHLETLYNNYNRTSFEFVQHMQKEKIYYLDSSALNAEVIRLDRKIRRNIKLISNNKLSLSESKENLEISDKIIFVLNQILSLNEDIQKSFSARNKFLVGPNMPSHEFVVDLKNKTTQLHALVNQYNLKISSKK